MSTFQDDLDPKTVYIQSAGLDKHYHGGERHAMLFWDVSRPEMFAIEVSKMVHLTGAYGGWTLSIETKRRGADYRQKNEIRALGVFTRGQRDRILTHARSVEFMPWSRVNSCRTWMRDLLKRIVEDRYLPLSREQFDYFDRKVPLLRRVREI